MVVQVAMECATRAEADDPQKQTVAVTVPGPERGEGPSKDDPQLPLTWGDELAQRSTPEWCRRWASTYWEDWAKDIASIADTHVTRITALPDDPDLELKPVFDRFLAGLRANLNDSITRDNAVEMPAQQIITKPVYDALFEGYDFTAHNPVSLVMQDILDVLDEHGIDTEVETLDRFNASVANRAKGVTTAEGKQRFITRLYEKFFRKPSRKPPRPSASSTRQPRSASQRSDAAVTGGMVPPPV